MKKLILGLVAATAVAAAAPAWRPLMSATTEPPTTPTAIGIANHIANFNGDDHGIGSIRFTQTGEQISGASAVRTPTNITVDSQGQYAPISNNG